MPETLMGFHGYRASDHRTSEETSEALSLRAHWEQVAATSSIRGWKGKWATGATRLSAESIDERDQVGVGAAGPRAGSTRPLPAPPRAGRAAPRALDAPRPARPTHPTGSRSRAVRGSQPPPAPIQRTAPRRSRQGLPEVPESDRRPSACRPPCWRELLRRASLAPRPLLLDQTLTRNHTGTDLGSWLQQRCF